MRSFEAYSYGCVMAVFPEALTERVVAFSARIPDADVYDDGSGEQGREDEAHITVKYGLHTDDPAAVEAVLGGEGPALAALGGMSVFHNEDCVVLKLGVESKDLERLNRVISKGLECTDGRPGYRPHATIAYLRHRKDDPYWYRELFGDEFAGEAVEFDRLRFSTPDKSKVWIQLGFAPMAMAARVAVAERVARRFGRR